MWCLDDFGVDRHLYSLKHVTTGEIDCRCHLESEIDIGFGCRYERMDNFLDISAGKIMGFQIVA